MVSLSESNSPKGPFKFLNFKLFKGLSGLVTAHWTSPMHNLATKEDILMGVNVLMGIKQNTLKTHNFKLFYVSSCTLQIIEDLDQ